MTRTPCSCPRGTSMWPESRSKLGYSLIELLIVLVIVGVLGMVSVTMVGNRPSAAVRGILDEFEGVLLSAQKQAVATGQDVVLSTSGEWSATNPLTLSLTDSTGTPITGAANHGFVVAHNATGLLREHLHGGVVTVTNATWWTTAQGSGSHLSTDINTVEPFSDNTITAFQSGTGSVLKDSTLNLFQGGSTPSTTVRVSGISKRFTTTFWIEVVGMSNGLPMAGGPMGVVVVTANGATVYKYFNPGLRNGDGTWRRI